MGNKTVGAKTKLWKLSLKSWWRILNTNAKVKLFVRMERKSSEREESSFNLDIVSCTSQPFLVKQQIWNFSQTKLEKQWSQSAVYVAPEYLKSAEQNAKQDLLSSGNLQPRILEVSPSKIYWMINGVLSCLSVKEVKQEVSLCCAYTPTIHTSKN